MTPGTPAWATYGDPSAGRAILLLLDGADGLTDPDPDRTARRRVAITAVAVAETTTVDGLLSIVPTGARGIIAVGRAGWLGLQLVALLGAEIERFVLVSVPATGSDDSRMAALVGQVQAKTLIVNGQRDPQAASRDAAWFKNRMASARVEMVPTARLVDGHLTLAPVWDRLLQHCGARMG